MNVHAKTGLTSVSGSHVWRRSGMGEVCGGRPPAPPRAAEGASLDIQHHRAPGAAAADPTAWEPRCPINTVELSSCQGQRTGSAAAKCSNQADLHLTFIDPICPSDLPQRPSSTSMPLATDQMTNQRMSAPRTPGNYQGSVHTAESPRPSERNEAKSPLTWTTTLRSWRPRFLY